MHGLETGIIPLRDEIAYAETRDPPSQDPRDHIEQAIRHDNSQEIKRTLRCQQRQRRVAPEVVRH